MLHSNRTPRTLHAHVTTVLCATLLTTGVTAAPVLQTIAVTPSPKSISVGQKQSFTVTGTFSNGSTRTLGPGISNIAPGVESTCALLISGGVKCWGRNDVGQLGDGNAADSLISRRVKGISTATAVTIDGSVQVGGHGCALLARGAIKCWGLNTSGQLGDGTRNSSATPVAVRGIGSATAVAAGVAHTCALLASGTVKCWGKNQRGELGNGFNRDSSIPVTVAGISTATALDAGGNYVSGDHSCTLLASGAVQCWGAGVSGQLGNGTTTSSNLPVTVSGIDNATAVAAGGESSCALLASGSVKCWGSNFWGQLGDGTGGVGGSKLFSSTPVFVIGISTATAITVGQNYACAVLSSGSAQCWGYNFSGELGNGTTENSNIPVDVGGIYAPIRLAAGDEDHTCALLSDGAMRCWGAGGSGQLGNRRKTRDPNPWPINVIGTPGVMWQSSDPAKATITDGGVATGRAVGNTTITATTAGSINDNAVLTVK